MADYQDGQRAVDDATGTPIIFQGGEWVEDTGTSPDVPIATPENFTGGAPAEQSTSWNPLDKEFAGVTWPGEGPLSMLDAAPPIIAPVHGLMTSKTAIRAGAEMGALATTIVDTVSYAAKKASELVSGTASGALDTVEKLLPGGLDRLVSVPRERYAARQMLEQLRSREDLVTSALKMGNKSMGAAAVPQRARPGLLDSATFEESLGLPSGTLSPTMRRDLDQLVDPSGQLVNDTRLARDAEMESLYTKSAGPDALAKLKQTQTAYTNKIAELAGVPRGTVPDKGAISAANETTGLEIDDIMRERFPDDVLQMNPDRPVSAVLGAADTSKDTATLLKKYGVIKQNADGEWEDVASLPATQLTEVRTKLKKQAEAATEAGDNIKAQTSNAALNRLDDMIEEAMPDDVKDQLAKLRFKYRVGKRLEKPGVIKEGQVDPGAFGKSWTHGSSKNKRMYDDLAILSDTAQEMTRVKHAGNSATRVIEGAGAGIGESIVGKILGR